MLFQRLIELVFSHGFDKNKWLAVCIICQGFIGFKDGFKGIFIDFFPISRGFYWCNLLLLLLRFLSLQNANYLQSDSAQWLDCSFICEKKFTKKKDEKNVSVRFTNCAGKWFLLMAMLMDSQKRNQISWMKWDHVRYELWVCIDWILAISTVINGYCGQ